MWKISKSRQKKWNVNTQDYAYKGLRFCLKGYHNVWINYIYPEWSKLTEPWLGKTKLLFFIFIILRKTRYDRRYTLLNITLGENRASYFWLSLGVTFTSFLSFFYFGSSFSLFLVALFVCYIGIIFLSEIIVKSLFLDQQHLF